MQFFSRLLKQKKHLIAGLVTLVWTIFVLPINEAIYFLIPDPNSHEYIVSLVLKAGFAATLYGAVYFLAYFANKLVEKSAFHWKWLKFFGVLFAINTVLFLLIYPGHFVSDEFNLLTDAYAYNVVSWQHIFTYLFYVFSLYIFPSAPILVLIQYTIISFIAGFMLAKVHDVLPQKKYLTFLLFIPLLLPPIILNNLYPLRTPLYGYLEVLLLLNFVFLYISKPKVKPYAALIGFTSLIAILGFWRSEGIYLIALLPLIIWRLGIINRTNYKRVKAWVLVALALLPIAFTGYLTKITSDPAYALTSVAGPISILATNPEIMESSAAEFESIGKVLNIYTLQQTADYTEIRSFWGLSEYPPVLMPGYEQHLSEFYVATAKLFLAHPVEFMKAKTNTFLHANALDPTHPYVTLAGVYLDKNIGNDFEDGRIDTFFSQNRGSHPINQEVKHEVTQALLLSDSNYKPTLARQVIWSAIPIGALLLAAFVYHIVRRRWIWAIAIAAILFQAAITFLTAPASYFMYYLPLYIAGWFLLGFMVVWWLSHRQPKKSR